MIGVGLKRLNENAPDKVPGAILAALTAARR